jgi:hypothetical protein
MGIDITIGTNPLPVGAQEKLGEFVDWLEAHYGIDQGSTALYWYLSYHLADFLVKEKPKCNVVFDFLSPHNGEYWYVCKTCGTRDWCAYYDKFENDEPLRGCKGAK